MSKLNKGLLIAAVAAVMSSAAMADTMQMQVKATVTGTCKMAAAPTLDFGTLDPAAPVAVTGVVSNVQYLCTRGKSPTQLTVGTSTNGSYTGAMVNGADSISFTLTWDNTTLPAGLGMATGKEVTVPVSGAIGATYANVAAGLYTVNVPITVTP